MMNSKPTAAENGGGKPSQLREHLTCEYTDHITDYTRNMSISVMNAVESAGNRKKILFRFSVAVAAVTLAVSGAIFYMAPLPKVVNVAQQASYSDPDNSGDIISDLAEQEVALYDPADDAIQTDLVTEADIDKLFEGEELQ